jgi:2,4-diketo-3-deoxy-L-fuconate hydrolase
VTFGVGTFALGEDKFTALVVDDRVYDLRGILGEDVTTRTLFDDWDSNFDQLETIASTLDPARGVPLEQVKPLPPVEPSQIFCAGANYYTHTIEMSTTLLRNNPDETRSDAELHQVAVEIADQVKASGQPFVFSGQPSALTGARDDIVLWGPGVEHDWELEVAVVIGKPAVRIKPEDAMSHIAGYTMCNDVSTRDVMFRPNFALTDFLMSKNRPTFFPLGPYIVPRQFIEDHNELRIHLSVNGEVMQDGSLSDLIYGIEELVAYVSHVAELRPGDIVLTGTPSGNAGAHGNRWLKPGDVIDSEVPGLGRQRNRCVADPR